MCCINNLICKTKIFYTIRYFKSCWSCNSLYFPSIYQRQKWFTAKVLSLSSFLVFKSLGSNIGSRAIVFLSRYRTLFYRIIQLIKITTTGTHQCANFTVIYRWIFYCEITCDQAFFFPICHVQKRSLTSQVTGKCETLKPGRTKILMECYCVASKKPIRHEKTKPQTAIVIVCGFQVSMHAPIFTLICQYTILLLTCQNQIKSLQFFIIIIIVIIIMIIIIIIIIIIINKIFSQEATSPQVVFRLVLSRNYNHIVVKKL